MIETLERKFIPEQFVLQERRPPIVLLLHGKNIGVGDSARSIQQAPLHLSVHSRFIAQAGAAIYQPGDFLLFTCGKTAGPDVDSEAQLLYTQAKRFNHLIPDIGDPNLFFEEESLNTDENALKNIPILRKHGLEGAFLLSVGFHVPRLTLTYKHYSPDMKFHGVSAEEVLRLEALRMSDQRMMSLLRSYKWSPQYQLERIKEGAILGSMVFDPESKILNRLTAKRGK